MLRFAPLILMLLPAGGDGSPAFSHEDWTHVLQRFVDDRGLVDYAGLSRDRVAFDGYLSAVEQISPVSHPERFPGRDDALAYYINAYNALVFRGVLDRGPDLDSVWGTTGTGYGFFVRMRVTLGGKQTNLKRLEDDVIRDQFDDPRIHAALNCASLGCPRLPRAAFRAERLEAALEDAMRDFVGQRQNCSVDASRQIVTLSKIFDWFDTDFLRGYDDKARGLIDYVNRYRDPKQQIPRNYKVKFAPYDKRINKQ